jgi:hypothetical protein
MNIPFSFFQVLSSRCAGLSPAVIPYHNDKKIEIVVGYFTISEEKGTP